MAELGKKLGKLSLAILENFVEGTLGKKFVDEVRAPTDRALAIESALENSERRFAREFSDKAFAENMFAQVSDQNLGLISDAIEKFYAHPTDPDFQNILNQIIAESFADVDTGKIKLAVGLYVNILTEEFALADEKFRENVRALADLRMVELLKRIESRQAPANRSCLLRRINFSEIFRPRKQRVTFSAERSKMTCVTCSATAAWAQLWECAPQAVWAKQSWRNMPPKI